MTTSHNTELPNYEQPTQSAYPYQPQQPTPPGPSISKGLAIAALIVGIVAFFTGLVPVLGALIGIAAIILGAIALSKKQHKGFALTGLILGALAAIASISVTAGLGAISGEISTAVKESNITAPVPSPVEKAEPEPEPAPEPEPETAPEPAVAPKPELSIGQSNAVRAAESYLRFTAFSRTGLIEQLEYEGFSTEDSTFATDHVNPDWNLQAAESAQNYLDFTSFSRQGLIDQLIFEGFTPEQAEYGVTAVGY